MKSSVLFTAEAGKGEEEEHDDKQFALEEVSNSYRFKNYVLCQSMTWKKM